jgi:hypothetical protein
VLAAFTLAGALLLLVLPAERRANTGPATELA